MSCCDCENVTSWWDKFKDVVDDFILRSNSHNCRGYKGDEKTVKKDRPSCINKYGNCKAQFPRTLYKQTVKTWNVGAAECGSGLQGVLHRAKDAASTYRLCPHLRTGFVLKFGRAKDWRCGET